MPHTAEMEQLFQSEWLPSNADETASALFRGHVVQGYLDTVTHSPSSDAEAESTGTSASEADDPPSGIPRSVLGALAAAFSPHVLEGLTPPADINEDDPTWSSDDEFADGDARAEQHIFRALVLGERPRLRCDADLDYLCDARRRMVAQLRDVRIALNELFPEAAEQQVDWGALKSQSVYRASAEDAVREIERRVYVGENNSDDGDEEQWNGEWAWGLILLAQALWREERKLKQAWRQGVSRGDEDPAMAWFEHQFRKRYGDMDSDSDSSAGEADDEDEGVEQEDEE